MTLLRLAYTAALCLLVPLVLLRMAWRGLRNPEYVQRWTERFGSAPVPSDGRPVICVHAVSVGEVMAAKPLLRLIAVRFPRHRVLITTVTPTGAGTVRQQIGDSVTHAYFPYDLPWAVERFLRRVRPVLTVIMETELWPNFYSACRKERVPLALVNARLSVRSYRRYRLLAGLARETLNAVSVISAQSEADARRFCELGARPSQVAVSGNLKFDVSLPRSVIEQGLAMRQFFSPDRPIWICASTHQGEESVVLGAYARLLASHPRCLLILAPRHPERFESVAQQCARAGLLTVRRTERRRACTAQTRVFLVDTMGELPVFYASADVAFVGGSLVPAGGHNVLEPACLGVALVTGSHMHNFEEVSELLCSAGGLRIVTSPEQLAACVDELLRDANLRHAMGERARSVFEANRGSAVKVMDRLAGLVK